MRLFFILFSILFLFACRKDDTYPANQKPPCDTTFFFNYMNDTIYPSDYLMAYPGSWWEYDIGTINCTEWRATPTYVRTKNAKGCLEITTNYNYMPWMESTLASTAGSSYTVSGDNYIFIDSNAYTSRWYTYILAYGEEAQVFGPSGGSDNYQYTVRNWFSCDSIFDTKELNGILFEDVIYVHHKSQINYDHLNGGPINEYGYYFAKNIGLVRQTVNGYVAGIYERNLVDYYIAPH